jgi:hypothetical protein
VAQAQERAVEDEELEAIYKRPPPIRADRQSAPVPPARVLSSTSIASEGDSSLYSDSSNALQIPPVPDSPTTEDRQEIFSDALAEGPDAEGKPVLPPRRRPVPAPPVAPPSYEGKELL